MGYNVLIGFNTAAENDVALRKIAAERRTDKTTILNEAVDVYLKAQDDDADSIYGAINALIDGLADGVVTVLEVKTRIQRLVSIACREQRAESEAEWSGANDND